MRTCSCHHLEVWRDNNPTPHLLCIHFALATIINPETTLPTSWKMPEVQWGKRLIGATRHGGGKRSGTQAWLAFLSVPRLVRQEVPRYWAVPEASSDTWIPAQADRWQVPRRIQSQL